VGKRSDFERVERDFYPTPPEPVFDLSPFLRGVRGFCEPCVGNGQLAESLTRLGHDLVLACDIEPIEEAAAYARKMDCLELTEADLKGVSHIITNPPWPAARGRGEPTLGIIRHLSRLRPTWLLLSADFAHNAYAAEVMEYCHIIVSVGRVKWIPDSKHQGVDNAAWYLFDQRGGDGITVFYGRGARKPIFANDIEGLL
jgi:hypothetical protein